MTVDIVQKLEIERKWLCKQTPSSEWLKKYATSSEYITQWYDKSGARLRKTEREAQEINWTYTEKSSVKFGVRVENEVVCGDLISQGVFNPVAKLMKIRYYIELNKRVWSADLVKVKDAYFCIIELEMDSEEELSDLNSCHPIFGEVLEITENKEWSSEKLAIMQSD